MARGSKERRLREMWRFTFGIGGPFWTVCFLKVSEVFKMRHGRGWLKENRHDQSLLSMVIKACMLQQGGSDRRPNRPDRDLQVLFQPPRN